MKRAPVAAPKPAPIRKERTIIFAELPPGQLPEAAGFLGSLERLELAPGSEPRSLDVAYDLRDHSLEELESALQDKGFHLDTSLLYKLKRALYYYAEETERRNLTMPERPLKQASNEAYIRAWERRQHGDHDTTPEIWREYR